MSIPTAEQLAKAPPSVQLHNQLQMASAGYTVEQALAASIMHLASIIAFASDTPAAAEQMIKTISGDLQRDVTARWDDSRLQRVNAGLGGGRA
ncbi:hypothetical protein [uncultured Brevundimonas sp.]|uniref:hypothetical protein n=1 Tax=uncultured Brevundimonas sp. TaxID=213418 RepID=UPI00260042EC|nr:hypothetical protein [uncultured Brevundimonas sp.]